MNMEALMKDLNGLETKGNLGKSVEDVQRTIDLLVDARNAITTESKSAVVTLARLQSSARQSFDQINDDLKIVHSGLNKYSKVLDKQFKDKPLPIAETDAISAHPALTNRAIAMHLLREGEFEVASTFIEEANRSPPTFNKAEPQTTISSNRNLILPLPSHDDLQDQQQQHQRQQEAWEQDFAQGTARSESLQRQFAEMYHILHELRQRHELGPAISWARAHSAELESRGSNLEFELCRLQFITFFLIDTPSSTSTSQSSSSSNASSTSLTSDPNRMNIDESTYSSASDINDTNSPHLSQEGPLRAWAYARREFGNFQARYAREIQELVGAIAFWQNMAESPYRHLFGRGGAAWDEVAGSFAREFCSLLGLSAESPLYSAATAGAIALPRIMKMQSIMKEKRTEWTTQHELPIEIPLPPAYHFHSIFVCPVSKEQGTDQNPPMRMPCGHVIAKESLEKLSKGSLFKCPYCPNESRPRDAKKVFL